MFELFAKFFPLHACLFLLIGNVNAGLLVSKHLESSFFILSSFSARISKAEVSVVAQKVEESETKNCLFKRAKQLQVTSIIKK